MRNNLNADLDDRGDLVRAIKTIIQLYTDKAHFVYELLQNAEDCKATIVNFAMFNNRLELMHNGEPFTQKNLTSIRSVGQTTKLDDINAIGKFGVGFKSVFSICKTYELHSNPNHFCGNGDYLPQFATIVEDFRYQRKIPVSKTEPFLPRGFTTKYVFPFCVDEDFSGYKTIDELHKKLAERLKGLGTSVLLFMKNIKEISYTIEGIREDYDSKGTFMLEKIVVDHALNCFKINTAGENSTDDVSYLMYSKSTKYGKDVNIAFACDWGTEGVPVFKNAPGKYICVYFPTDTESKVNFVVQAPFGTTPNRGGIPETDDNISLSEELGYLLRIAILDIRDKGWLTLELLNIMPLDDEQDYGLLNALHNETMSLIESERVLPTISDGYTTKELARIVRGEKIAKLFAGRKLCALLDEDGVEWMPVTLTENNKAFADLHSILTDQIYIEEIDAGDLPVMLRNNIKFWDIVDDKWLESFYNYLLKEQKGMLGKDKEYATVEIIKTTSGKMVAAYTKSRGRNAACLRNVYICPKNTGKRVEQFNFVSEFIVENCSDFLTAMDIGEPDGYDYLMNELASQYNNDEISEEDQLSQMIRAIKYLKEDNHDNADEEFRKRLRLRYVSPKGVRGKITTCEITPLYYPNDSHGFSIEDYFSGTICNVGILDQDFYEEKGIKCSDLAQLNRIGIKTTVINYGEDYWWETNTKCLNIGDFKHDMDFDNINEILVAISNGNKSKSSFLFSILKRVEKHLSGEYRRGTTLKEKNLGVSKIIERLNGYRWLWDKNGNLTCSSGITRNELDKEYGEVDRFSRIYQILGFKEDQSDKLIDAFSNLTKTQQKQVLERFASIQDEVDEYDPEIDETADDFPNEPIIELNRLIEKTKKAYANAQPVQYDYIVIHKRTSGGGEKEHLKHRYSGFCQSCGIPNRYWEVAEIFDKPKKELEQLYLSLCPNCASEYRRLRKDDKVMIEFRKALINSKVDNKDRYIFTISNEFNIAFTMVHFVEIQTILKEMEKK